MLMETVGKLTFYEVANIILLQTVFYFMENRFFFFFLMINLDISLKTFWNKVLEVWPSLSLLRLKCKKKIAKVKSKLLRKGRGEKMAN